MNTYETDDGLVKRWVWEGRVIENQFLYALVLFILTGEKKKELQDFLIKAYDQESGLYKNHIDPEMLRPHPKVSRDQVLAYAVFCHLTGYKFNSYDRLSEYNLPWNDCIAIKGIKLLYPYLYFQMIFTYLFSYLRFKFFKTKNKEMNYTDYSIRHIKEASSFQLWWLRLKLLDSKGLNWLFTVLCKLRFGSLEGMMRCFYSYDDNHPILKEINKLDNEGN